MSLAETYWVVQDTNPGTQVFSSTRGFVANSDATFLAWLNLNDGSAFAASIGGFVSSADNGAGLIRVTCGSTSRLTSNQYYNYVGGTTGAAGAKQVTVIGATQFDIVGSTFSQADATAVLWGAQWIATAADLFVALNQLGLSLVPTVLGTFKVNATNVGIGLSLTLTNPMADVQILTGTPGAAFDLILAPANQSNSYPIGQPMFIANKFTTSAAIRVRANDGTTLIGTIPNNTDGRIVLQDNSTTNGTWTPTSLGLIFPGAGWNPNQGGTGLTGATVTAHAVPIVQSAGIPFNQVVLGDAQLLVGQSSADPLARTVGGDATMDDAGAFTVTGTHGVAFGPFATLAAPLAVVYGGTQTTVAPAAGQVLIAQSGSLYSPTALTGGATLTAGGTVVLGNPAAAQLGGAFSYASVANQFLTSLNTSGSLAGAQPAVSGLSGLPVAAIYGGTQTTVAPAAGQVLIAQSGSLYSPTSLIGGATLAASGTVILANPATTVRGGLFSYASVANQFLVSLATSGSLTGAQPAVGNLSGFGTGVATALGNNTNATGGFPTVPVSVAAGGTNQTAAPVAGQVLIAQSATAFAPMTLSGGATVSAGGTVTLGTPGTAVLGGLFSFASVSNQFLTSLATSGSLTAAQPVLNNLAGTLVVASGGTGRANQAAHAVLLGAGTSAVNAASPIGVGALLLDQGAAVDPAFALMSGDGTISSAGVLVVTKTGGTLFTGAATASYTAPTSYSPTDQSGASLTFTSVSVQYMQIGNMVHIYGTLTYPTTANTSAAIISLPVAVPNQTYARVQGSAATSNAIGSNLLLQSVPNTSTARFFQDGTGGVTNVQLSGVQVFFMLIYPAS